MKPNGTLTQTERTEESQTFSTQQENSPQSETDQMAKRNTLLSPQLTVNYSHDSMHVFFFFNCFAHDLNFATRWNFFLMLLPATPTSANGAMISFRNVGHEIDDGVHQF